jgi:hypothetical protein
MPAITDRSKTEPLLKTVRLGHGTLECADLVEMRRANGRHSRTVRRVRSACSRRQAPHYRRLRDRA